MHAQPHRARAALLRFHQPILGIGDDCRAGSGVGADPRGRGVAAVGLTRLDRTDLGFRTDRRAAFQIQFPEAGDAAHERRVQFVRELELNPAREPQIKSFAFTGSLPVGDSQWGGGFVPQRANGEFDRDSSVLHFRRVTPGYVRTMGIGLIEGRLLNDRATEKALTTA